MRNRRQPKREILISRTPYDKRIAVMENGELIELVVESEESNRVLGNIYKGVVQKVLPGLKAAFVDLGLAKAGFLHVDDVVDRNKQLLKEYGEDGDHSSNHQGEVSIDQLLTAGQEIMVQITKEPISTKGARLTTHLIFPGRFLVCMPGTNFVGVSKKERDPSNRKKLRRAITTMKGDDVGYIVRTNGLRESETELRKQMASLESKWVATQQNFETAPPCSPIYQESDSTETTLRDYFSDNTDFVYVDDKAEYLAMKEYLNLLSPDKVDKIKLWSGNISLFEQFKIENEYERTIHRNVRLKRGGSLVIEQTEAMVSIDINTGPKVHGKDQAKIILETNIDACQEIAKQMRLRDVGGLILIDFIDMDSEADRDTVIDEFKKAIRKDKAPISFVPLSPFCLLEVTRKRVRVNLLTEKTTLCPTCDGRGFIYSKQTVLSTIDRWFARAQKANKHKEVTLVLSTVMCDYLVENRGQYFKYIEDKYGLELDLVENEAAPMNEVHFFNTKNNEEISAEYSFRA
jgi:ribonuclease G